MKFIIIDRYLKKYIDNYYSGNSLKHFELDDHVNVGHVNYVKWRKERRGLKFDNLIELFQSILTYDRSLWHSTNNKNDELYHHNKVVDNVTIDMLSVIYDPNIIQFHDNYHDGYDPSCCSNCYYHKHLLMEELFYNICCKNDVEIAKYLLSLKNIDFNNYIEYYNFFVTCCIHDSLEMAKFIYNNTNSIKFNTKYFNELLENSDIGTNVIEWLWNNNILKISHVNKLFIKAIHNNNRKTILLLFKHITISKHELSSHFADICNKNHGNNTNYFNSFIKWFYNKYSDYIDIHYSDICISNLNKINKESEAKNKLTEYDGSKSKYTKHCFYYFGNGNSGVYLTGNETSFKVACINKNYDLVQFLWITSEKKIDINDNIQRLFNIICENSNNNSVNIAKFLYENGNIDIHWNDDAYFEKSSGKMRLYLNTLSTNI